MSKHRKPRLTDKASALEIIRQCERRGECANIVVMIVAGLTMCEQITHMRRAGRRVRPRITTSERKQFGSILTTIPAPGQPGGPPLED